MAVEPERTAWKRLNFFKGLITSEADWAEEEEYRCDKRRLHNHTLHSPGVVRGYSSDLRVVARGDLSIEIQPGAAVDGSGREIILWELQVKNFPAPDPKADTTFVLVLRYTEQATDFVAYKHNLAIRGHRRMLESYEIDVVAREPRLADEVELARVLLDRSSKSIIDARNPLAPRANEIDMTQVRRAGTAGSRLNTLMRLATDKMFMTLRGPLRLMARGKVFAAIDASAALIQAEALHRAQLLDRGNMADTFWPVVEALAYLHDELFMYFPEIAQRKEVDDYFRLMKTMRRSIWESGISDETVKGLYLNLSRAADLIGMLAVNLPNQKTQIRPR